jgi:YHS domain-containing protein
MAKDQVCRMEVDEEKAPAKSQHMGKTYYFCVPACKRAFDEDPAKYTWTGGHEMAEHGSHKMYSGSFTCILGERTATLLVPQLGSSPVSHCRSLASVNGKLKIQYFCK